MALDAAFLGFAFAAGTASFLNPCGIAMLPAYVSYTLARKEENATQAQKALLGLKLGAAVSLGFLLVFLSFGLVSSYIGTHILQYVPWAATLIGALLVLLGLALFFNKSPSLPGLHVFGEKLKATQTSGLPAYFTYGVGYAIASLACTLPIFAAIVLASFTQASALEAVAGFFVYAGGMGSAMIALTLATVLSKGLFIRQLQAHYGIIRKITALVIIAAGAYIIYYQTVFTLA